MVGARSFDSVGVAFVFEQQPDGQWNNVAQLRSSSPDASAWYGFTVELHGDLLVAARLEDKVYVYRRNNGSWDESQVISAGARYDQFGYSLALSDNRALIGAPITNDGRLGVVHLYERTPNDLLFILIRIATGWGAVLRVWRQCCSWRRYGGDWRLG